jgi:two-component system cell cycle sensor histidine kinase/response regulator CckA
MLHRYGLADIPASVAKAKMDAGVSMAAIEVGQLGFIFAIGRGTGLGLASAYGIVRNHGGFIDVRSQERIGTTFTVHLKASDTQPGKTALMRASAQAGNETILVVDDDPLILDVGQALLVALGYAVVVATGGKAAIGIYRDQKDRIRLVILDMIMPDMGGGHT